MGFQKSKFTPKEQSCISKTIDELMTKEGYEQDKAVAAAISMCAPSKAISKHSAFAMDLISKQVDNTPIKIRGGNYTAVDTGDGYFTILDVPIMAEIPKGTKGAPDDVDEGWHEKCVATMQKRYIKGKFAGALSIGHNKDLDIEDPKFAGFFLPKRVGRMVIDDQVQSCIFADLKMPAEAFEQVRSGKLAYLSPEVWDWDRGYIDIVSFIPTKPPYFSFPLFTIGEVVKDQNARFDANYDGGRFMATKKAKMQEEKKEETQSDPTEEIVKKVVDTIDARLSAMEEDIKSLKGGKMEEDKADDKKPVEPEGEMECGPEKEKAKMDAKLAADVAALKDRLDKKDDEEKTDARTKAAFEALKGYQYGDNVKSAIAKFAAMGQEELDTAVESWKESLTKLPPTDVEEITEEEAAADPIVGKFHQEDPRKGELAKKALAEFNSIRKQFPNGFKSDAEGYVKRRVAELLA
jgi:hypothetical protein